MNRLLSLICLLLNLAAVAQGADPAGNGVSSAGNGVRQMILQQYCSESYEYTPNLLAINLYQQKLDLHLKFDPDKIADYDQTPASYYDYPVAFRYTSSGPFYGPVNANMYNPYGARTPSEAIVFGTVNYFLNRRHK